MADPQSQEIASDGPIRVMIVDDHHMVADALARVVSNESDFVLAGVAYDLADAVVQIGREPPEVILMDYRLPDGDGATATAQILARWPDVKVIMLTGFGSEEILVRAIESGCVGMLSKVRPASDVVTAVRNAWRGISVLTSEELAGLMHRFTRPAAGNAGELTPREFEVLRLLGRAKTVEMIAAELFMSVHTARNHISSILSKLGAHSKLEAVTIAARDGLISLSDIG